MDKCVIELPDDVKKIIGTIEEHGCQAYAVGGCVRDSILGKTPDDWDITTSAVPNQVKMFFKRTIDTGIQHGTVTVMFGKNGYEVTTYRIDGDYLDGRHPESVEFAVNLIEDLKRRDFTINAMAYNDNDGIIDEFNGIEDLDRKIIRCVGDAEERFTEDALRMMRAIRFSAQLGFEIEKNTYDAIKKLAPTISKVSMERVQVELIKTLKSPHPEYVKLYSETGIMKVILPAIDEVLNGRYSRNALTMLKHCRKEPALIYAALLNTLPADRVKETLKSLKLDNYTVDTAAKLVDNSKVTIEENEPAIREAIHKYGRDFIKLMCIHEHALLETSEEVTGISMIARKKHLHVIERSVEEILTRGDCVTVKDLDISGHDLMEYGLSGPEIGITLEELLRVVIENPKLNDKMTLIALIEHLK